MAKSLLFVCTFNSGRSAASEYLVRRMLRQKDERLARLVRVSSAGFLTKEEAQRLKGFGLSLPKPFFGRPAHRYMITLMERRGIDISRHRSRGLNRVILDEADLIIVFGERLKTAVLSFWPHVKGKLFSFEELAGDEYRVSLDSYPAPYADGDFVDYPVEPIAPLIEEMGRFLPRAVDKSLNYLHLSGASGKQEA